MLNENILKKIINISDKDFELLKSKTFDSFSAERFSISQVSHLNFYDIIYHQQNKDNFIRFKKLRSIIYKLEKQDILKFYRDIFISEENIKFTVYVN